MLRIYRQSAITSVERSALSSSGVEAKSVVDCYYIETLKPLREHQDEILDFLLGGAYGTPVTERPAGTTIEVGPRLSFASSWSTTATEIARRAGLDAVSRIEKSRVFEFGELSSEERRAAEAALHDRMTQQVYERPLESFASGAEADPVRTIDLLGKGEAELKRLDKELGMAMDDEDVEHVMHIFRDVLKRNPTDVELFQIGQANSEHCRHHVFRAKIVLDGVEQEQSLMDLIKAPYKANPANSVIAFHDDSSAIEGARALLLMAEDPAAPSALRGVAWKVLYTMTAETHNFPTGVAPFPGAATGTGGRIRDNQSVGRGGRTSASLVGYATGDWWDNDRPAGHGVRTPLEIILGAMQGAWGYGNSFGEPVIGGWTRTLDLVISDVRYAYLKPILYSAGAGFMREEHALVEAPAPGMSVVQIGGPAYRIGMGGGAGSSREGSKDTAELDYNAVQRGDPATGEVVGRVVDACIALGEATPIVSAHDLGAGGDANALPEIVDPQGARIELRAIPSGDSSLSVLELWGNESQERIAVLVRPRHLEKLARICDREGCPMAVVGQVTGDGKLTVYDDADGSTPVDLPLDEVLGEVPRKTIRWDSRERGLKPLKLPEGLEVMPALEKVLALPAVASKWAIISGVDRCVTGLVAQQQCVGPDHVPVSDFSAVADGYYGFTGRAYATGERALFGLVSPAAQGRMTVAEAVTNLMGAKISSLPEVRASVNVMAAARQPGEGAEMYQAYVALSSFMTELGMAADGGKDSLSLAVSSDTGMVRGPRELVVAAYAAMPDVRVKATPDLKEAGSELLLVDLGGGQARLGGSALAQAYGQAGDECPDLENAALLARAFETVQSLVAEGAVRSLHDRSDGGLITTVLEMAFAGVRGCDVILDESHEVMAAAFAEEAGVVIECADGRVKQALSEAGIPYLRLGRTGQKHGEVLIRHRGRTVVRAGVLELRKLWEATGSRLDTHQTDPGLVAEETGARQLRQRPEWRLSYAPTPTPRNVLLAPNKPRVAVLREVGTNGDRELAAAFEMAGFEAWDVMTSDLLEGRVSLADFRGLAMAGGFAFGDVLGAGVGWAGEILYHRELAGQFAEFQRRSDTFTFGVCNGAQLSTLLGLVSPHGVDTAARPRLVTNESQRFECRFVQVAIQESPAIMLQGMAGSSLGIWVAHGEGRLNAGSSVIERIERTNLAPIRYVGPDGSPTTAYPANPNGSPGGIAALCSPDGRHLAMMPHPERLAHQLWQWPYLPEEWQGLPVSPWLKMFQNAYEWCTR
jgi:phosphoribosylformylglycinamidine synthase